MLEKNLRSQLIELFQETGSAHHEAFIETDGADPEWPLWYADYVREQLAGLIEMQCTTSELVYLLVLVEKERMRRAPHAPWAEYYADFFVERYQAMQGHMPGAPKMRDEPEKG